MLMRLQQVSRLQPHRKKPRNTEVCQSTANERQNLLKRLALHGLSEGADSLINFLPFVNRLRGIMGAKGEEILRHELGSEYDKIMKEYLALSSILDVIEAYKTGLENHTIDREDVTSKRFMKYIQMSAMLPLTSTSAFRIGGILLRHTQIKDL